MMSRKEGIFGLLKGNGTNVLKAAPFSAFEMFFYDHLKKHFFGGH